MLPYIAYMDPMGYILDHDDSWEFVCLQKSHESSPYLQLPNVSQWLAKLVNIAPISCLGSLGVFCVSMC